MKKLVAYSSVSHLGFVMLGIAAFTHHVASWASVYQMLNHGISTGALFFLVGMLYERRHTRQHRRVRRAQERDALVLRGSSCSICLSSIAVPGFNGFVGEFLILLGSWSFAPGLVVVAVAGRGPGRRLHALDGAARAVRRGHERRRTRPFPTSRRARRPCWCRSSRWRSSWAWPARSSPARIEPAATADQQVQPAVAPRAGLAPRRRPSGERRHDGQGCDERDARPSPAVPGADRGGHRARRAAGAGLHAQGPAAPPRAAVALAGLLGGARDAVSRRRATARARCRAAASRPDAFALFFHVLILGIGIVVVLLSPSYLRAIGHRSRASTTRSLLFSIVGMLGLVSCLELVSLFVALEIMSVALYGMAGLQRDRLESQEAALKYFVTGAFSSAFFLYGVALLYGVTGSTSLARIARSWAASRPTRDPGACSGTGLLLVGLRLQGGERAVPHVGPRRLRGRAHHGDRLHGGGRQGRRLRRRCLRVFAQGLPGLGPHWQPAGRGARDPHHARSATWGRWRSPASSACSPTPRWPTRATCSRPGGRAGRRRRRPSSSTWSATPR